jgi:hypothetical protein
LDRFHYLSNIHNTLINTTVWYSLW